jgi:hypothetical protein
MSAAVKPSTGGDVPAFIVSVGLHAAFLALPILASFYGRTPAPPPDSRANSVAMVGNSIEVDAPTPEVAAAPAAAADPGPEPVDVNALPAEPAVARERTGEAPPASATAPSVAPAAPRPRRQALPKPRPSARQAASNLAGSEAPTTGAPAAGTFGQEGLAPGVRRLGYAFTRAIPAATPADEAWRELPAGHVGTIRIELSVDEDNHLGELKRWRARPGEPAPPAVLERMVQRTLLLLRAGQFALSGSNQPGSERLVIDVTLRDDTADDESSNNVVNKGFDGASPGHPGRAHFRYGTGRTFEAKITIVSSGQ